MTPIFLRHRDATRQAIGLGAVAALLIAVTLVSAVAFHGWVKLAALVVAIPAFFFTRMSIRLATLRVRLDDAGLWEPNPFRLTHVTPWSEIWQVRSLTTEGRVRFVSVQLTYHDGERREIIALKMQAGAAGSEVIVDRWVEAIREARRAALTE